MMANDQLNSVNGLYYFLLRNAKKKIIVCMTTKRKYIDVV